MRNIKKFMQEMLEKDDKIHADGKNEIGCKKESYNHVIYFIHGVENIGKNGKSIKKHLEENLSLCIVKPISYGSLLFLGCLIPWIKKNKIKKLFNKLEQGIEEANKEDLKVSFICHSCGTHILLQVINKLEIHHLKYIIFCGSIVNRAYDFSLLIKKNSQVQIINECGTKDLVPALAASVTASHSYSATGSAVGFGASQQSVEDRVHNIGHGGYFKEGFIKEFWVPLFEDGKTINNNEEPMQVIPKTAKSIEHLNLHKTTPAIFASLLITPSFFEPSDYVHYIIIFALSLSSLIILGWIINLLFKKISA